MTKGELWERMDREHVALKVAYSCWLADPTYWNSLAYQEQLGRAKLALELWRAACAEGSSQREDIPA